MAIWFYTFTPFINLHFILHRYVEFPVPGDPRRIISPVFIDPPEQEQSNEQAEETEKKLKPYEFRQREYWMPVNAISSTTFSL